VQNVTHYEIVTSFGKLSGFQEVYERFDTEECVDHKIHAFEFKESEIVRSKILKFIVKVLEAKQH
jgi:activator of HSP90 ATPase